MSFSLSIGILLLLPLFCAPLIRWLGGRHGDKTVHALAAAVTAAEFLLVLSLLSRTGETASAPTLFLFGLNFSVTGFQAWLAVLAGFLWLMTTLFCPYYFHGHGGAGRYQFYSLLTLSAIEGVFLSADFATLLVFFEIMSITSWVMVIHEQTPSAIDAAGSYLGFAIFGGLCTMLGLFMLWDMAGTLRFAELPTALAALPRNGRYYTCGVFILIGFAAKAGMFPLHTWLPAAHPAAPAPASALLSGIITKAGVFGACAVSVAMFPTDAKWGMGLLCFAVITMLGGAVLAIFSIDLKRTLACSSMSQIGFILVGVAMQRLMGEHGTIAAYGTILHISNHSLLKLCLFLCAGVLVRCCHSRDLNDLKGFGRGKKVFLAAFLIGALGITCMPLFGGYVSKTLLHESIVEYMELLREAGESVGFFKLVEILFLASGGFTVAYMTKLFAALFIDRNDDQAKMDAMNGSYLAPLPAVVLLLAAATSPVLGILTDVVTGRIAELCVPFFDLPIADYVIRYFALENLKGALISLAVGGVTYFGFIRPVLIRNGRYVNVLPGWLDLEKSVYRPLLLRVLPTVFAFIARLAGSLFDWFIRSCRYLINHNDEHLGQFDEDNTFGVYPKDTEMKRGASATLAYGLALTGIVLIAAFVWVFLHV